ncbi:MAG: hypothetical protein KAY32_15585 [Candidatus Eisenbacteria sp.]|nr:hypothetical protein [Candidatus Eisenbacteria bacterium]
MRRLIGLAVLLPLTCIAANAAEGLSHDFSYDIDIREAVDGSDALGIDFDLHLDLARGAEIEPGHRFHLATRFSGYQNFDSDRRDINHMLGELALRGDLYLPQAPKTVEVEKVQQWLKLSNSPPESLTVEDMQELTRLSRIMRGFDADTGESPARVVGYLSYDLHYRFETTQDVTAKLHAFGLGASAEMPLLGEILDAVLGVTRSEEPEGRRARPLLLYAAIDLATSEDLLPTYDHLRDDDTLWRGRIELAWRTSILRNQKLTLSWQGEVLFDAPQAIDDADREFNSFFEATLIMPVKNGAGLLVKYVDGRLSPTYEQVAAALLGVNLSLGGDD